MPALQFEKMHKANKNDKDTFNKIEIQLREYFNGKSLDDKRNPFEILNPKSQLFKPDANLQNRNLYADVHSLFIKLLELINLTYLYYQLSKTKTSKVKYGDVSISRARAKKIFELTLRIYDSTKNPIKKFIMLNFRLKKPSSILPNNELPQEYQMMRLIVNSFSEAYYPFRNNTIKTLRLDIQAATPGEALKKGNALERKSLSLLKEIEKQEFQCTAPFIKELKHIAECAAMATERAAMAAQTVKTAKIDNNLIYHGAILCGITKTWLIQSLKLTSAGKPSTTRVLQLIKSFTHIELEERSIARFFEDNLEKIKQSIEEKIHLDPLIYWHLIDVFMSHKMNRSDENFSDIKKAIERETERFIKAHLQTASAMSSRKPSEKFRLTHKK